MTTPSFVFSLDFELMWGVRDHRSIKDYGDAVQGVRCALPRLLNLLESYGIRATWATVGLLFARNRNEMLEHFPAVRPNYRLADLSPLEAIRSQIGDNEEADPYHYGRSLVDRVMQVPGQEMATHTYSHYYCLEEGQSTEAFAADLQAAIDISAQAGTRPTSIVFPRNQMTEEHVRTCASYGIKVFRGNPSGFAYRARSQEENSPVVRGLRLLDACFPLTGRHSYQAPSWVAGCADVRASRFFRPYSKRMGKLNDLHVSRITREMQQAARANEVFHLWCHPHNFGRHTDMQLHRLEKILKVYRQLSGSHGMRSKTMTECAAQFNDLIQPR